MKLIELNRAERESLLELAYKVANIDVNYSGKEIGAIKRLKSEIEIDYIPVGKTVDELIESLKGSSDSAKKLVYFKIAGIIFSDLKEEKKEEEVLSKMESVLAIDPAQAKKLVDSVKSIEESFAEVNKIIG